MFRLQLVVVWVWRIRDRRLFDGGCLGERRLFEVVGRANGAATSARVLSWAWWWQRREHLF